MLFFPGDMICGMVRSIHQALSPMDEQGSFRILPRPRILPWPHFRKFVQDLVACLWFKNWLESTVNETGFSDAHCGQWFSPGDDFAPSLSSKGVFVKGGEAATSILWVEARDAAKHRAAPFPNKERPIPKSHLCGETLEEDRSPTSLSSQNRLCDCLYV